jgi:hypothetical protein
MPFCSKCGSNIVEEAKDSPECNQHNIGIAERPYNYSRNPCLFENRVAQIAPSVIAFAAGTSKMIHQELLAPDLVSMPEILKPEQMFSPLVHMYWKRS